MLAYYLWNNRSFPGPDESTTLFRLEPRLWEQVQSDTQFLAARQENKISLFWDHLIEYLTGHYLDQTLEYGNDMSVQEYERIVRIMASEIRFSRRLLAKWMVERRMKAKGGYVGSIMESIQDDVLYVLLVGPGDGGGDHEKYRTARAEQLYDRCVAAKAARPDRTIIVGISLDAPGVKGSSEDFILLDTSDWSPEQLDAAATLREELGYFVDGKAKFSRSPSPNTRSNKCPASALPSYPLENNIWCLCC